MTGCSSQKSFRTSGFRLSTVLAVAVLAASPLLWALANTSFEATDGNLVADGGTDWQSFIGNGLVVGQDLPQGQSDDSFSDKEDNPAPEIVTGSIPNNKSDLMRFYVANEKVDVAGMDNVFLYLGWVRSNTLGSANMDFEFNQSPALSANGVTPERTEGDLLITFGFSGNDNSVDLGLSRWHETGNDCEASNSAPCWGPIMPLQGPAEGSVNNDFTTFDPIENVTLEARTFGEAAINLTAAGVFDLDECVTFGGAYVKSRSSTSFTSALKDFIQPIEVSVSNCATLTITKDAIPDDDQDFHFTGPAEIGAESFFLDDDGDDGNALPSSTWFEGRFDQGPMTITEEPATGWDLTDASCSVVGGTPTTDSDPTGGSVTIDAGAGDNLHCTFTNTKRGNILVYQVTDPGGDPQLFGFNLTGGPAVDPVDQAFNLSDGAAPHDTGLVRPGTYSVGQLDPGAEWDLTNATCDDGSEPSSVVLDPGETVACTFTNTKRGRILIDEVTDPSGEPDSFDFTLAGGPDSIDQAFGLTDTATPHDSGLVRNGNYNANQATPPAGWDLDSATCDDGSSPGSIALDPGETVTCTFTNIARGRVMVDVVTDPAADPQTFDFGMTGGPGDLSSSFSLADLTTPHDSGMLQPGTYAISDTSPGAEWDLSSASCDDGSDPSSVGLGAGETVTCTYTYVKRGHILVDVTTNPGGEAQVFDFTLGGGPADAVLDQAFGLADGSIPHDSGAAKADSYAVTPLYAGADWDLASSSCNDGSDPSAVSLQTGETVTCTFNYVKRGHLLVDVVTDPSADAHVFDFTLAGGPVDAAVDQAFGLADASTPHDSGVVKPDSYAVTALDADPEWDLGSATCDDGSDPSAVGIGPGETVTCTFTYVKRAHIFVDVVTDPSGDSQSFDFGLSGTDVDQAFSLADGSSPYDSGALQQGGYAVNDSDPGAEWDLDPAQTGCDNGDETSAVSVGPGDSVTCTFTYVKRGHILIDKVTVPSGELQSFDFHLTGGPDTVDWGTSLADGSTPWDGGAVRPGNYAAAELPAGGGWDLDSTTCDDGSEPGSISVQPGETVTCTFTNVKRGKIMVDVITDPSADPQTFDFGMTGGPSDMNTSFSLADLTPPHDSGMLEPGGYAISDTAPGAEWDLSSASCDDGSDPSSVGLGAGETVTCTYTYVKRGHILVDVTTNPGGEPQVFDFTLGGGPADAVLDQAFGLADGSIPHDSGAAKADSYAVTPLYAGADWDLASSSCNDGSDPSAVSLQTGETVTCTFNYVKRGHLLVDVVTDPSADAHVFDFTLAGGPVDAAVDQAFGLADASTPHDSGVVKPDSYAVTALDADPEWDLGSATCDDGSDPSAVGIGPGETVTCTFTYVKRAHIFVDVVTDPSGDSQSFDFGLSGTDVDQAFSLADGSSPYDSGALQQGGYAVNDSDPGAEWDLDPAQTGCDNGDETSAVSVGPGDSVTCTFTYVKRGHILIDKVTVPSGELQSFDFHLTGGPDTVDWGTSLADGSTPWDGGAVRPGTYAAAELPAGGGWDLDSATCNDGSDPGSISIQPGETVTCTFTNVKRGKIMVDVVTDPSADPETFDFGMTGGPGDLNSSFSLADLTPPHDSGMLEPGDYAIADTSPGAEWDLVSSACDDQSDPTAVKLDAGETVMCTYTYSKRGHILVDVTTNPGGEAQVFDFTLGGGPADAVLDQAFGLADGSTPHDSGAAKADSYAVTPLYAGADWDLASSSCNDGSDPSAVSLQTGETVTCTFNYVKRGHLVVDVITDPSADAHVFDFTLGGGPADATIDQAFGLADASTPHDSGVVKPDSYAVTALDADPEWDLGSATCDDGSDPSAVGIGPGETVTCTFTYVKRAHIFVDVVTDPSGDAQSFDFGLSGTDVDQAFSLADGSSPYDSGALQQGGYAVNDSDPGAEWDLDPAQTGCDNGDATSAVSVGPGDSVTCTFTYVKRGHILIDKVTVPSGDAASFDFTLAGGPDGVDSGTSLTDQSSAWNSGPIRPGTYAAAEGAAGDDWDLTAATCDDDSEPGSISVEPGETVTCTFTNTKRAILTIVKESIPDSPQNFYFSITGTDYAGTMTLDDDDDPVRIKTGSVMLAQGAYSVVESDPGVRWDLTDIQCTDSAGSVGSTDLASRSAQVDLAPGAAVTCVFTDVMRGRIFVEKNVAIPYTGEGFDPTNFPFDFDGSWGDEFSLKHGKRRNSGWILAGTSYTISESPPSGWQVSSECTYDDGSLVSGGSSISVDLAPGEDVHCIFTNDLTIYSGSSGFWKNWSNHFSRDQYDLIMRESLEGSPIYVHLFDDNGDLIPGAFDIIQGLYDNGGASNEQSLIRELTTMMLNVGMTKEPELQAWRQGDGLCLDCVVNADMVPGAIELLENRAPCPAGDGVWRVQDVLDIVEAAWNGNMAVPDMSMQLMDSEVSILRSLTDGINDGRYMEVDASGYPDDLRCLSAPGPATTTWYRDGDGDGYGDYDHRLQVCDGSTPDGHVNDDFTDCDDDEALSNPGMSELCDGLDNDCDGVVDTGTDTDADGIDDMCDAFPNDPDRSGPFVVSGLEVDDLWQPVGLPGFYKAPVVIAGAPTHNDDAPGVVQIDEVTDRDFDVRFKEWEYLDGVHQALESVGYMVSEAGRYTMPDGSVWEFGTFALDGTAKFSYVPFTTGFDRKPAVFVTAQSVAGKQPVTVRARNVGRHGFEAALYEEEARMDGHLATPVGYVAIYSPEGFGDVQPLGSDLPYYLHRPRLDDRFTPVLSWTVKLDEEDSSDNERWHIDENVWVMALGHHVFVQDASAGGRDTVSPRVIQPDPSVAMEWGSVDDVADKWIQIPLARTYTDPVVVVKVASSRDMDPGTLRLRNVTADSFELRFEEWAYLDDVHDGERVFFMVAESGQHDLGGLAVEAGTRVSSATKNADQWEFVNLTAPFADAPGVFSAIQTHNDGAPAVTRVKQRQAGSFKLTMQEEEASPVDGRGPETLGWIAVDMGNATLPNGRYIEIIAHLVDDAYRTVHFTPADPGRRFRTVVADLASSYGDDAANMRHTALGRNRVRLMVQEEQSLDPEMNHTFEDVCIFVAE